MTETTLFQRTLIALGATIIVPLFVAVTGLGGNNQSVQQRLDDYISPAVAPVEDSSSDTDADNNKDKDQAKNEEKSTDKDNSTQQQVGNASTKSAGNYTVKDGDTYGCIAENYYGSYDQWTRVYNANAGWPGFDEYRLDIGAKIQMPAVTATETLPKTNLCD